MRKLAVNLSTAYANLCTWVIAPSASIAKRIQQQKVKTEISVIPTGVDIDFFRNGDGVRFREAMDIPAGRRIIGYVGRLKIMAATASEDAKSFSRKTVANKLFNLYQNAAASHTHQGQLRNNPHEILNALFQALQTEWELLSEKASAVMHSIQ